MICRNMRYALITLSAMSPYALPALAQTRLLPDQPRRLEEVEAVCTGISLDARQDPRWQAYPLKVEVAGKGGQYLGEVTLSLLRQDKEIATVACDGPWILFRVPAGRYQLKAETEGRTVTSAAFVPATGQGRVILRFPDVGGEIVPPSQGSRPDE